MFNLNRHLISCRADSDTSSEDEQVLEQKTKNLKNASETSDEETEIDEIYETESYAFSGSSEMEDMSSENEDMSSENEDLRKCEYCDKYYTRKNLNRHKKGCKHRRAKELEEKLKAQELKIKELEDVKKEKEEIEKEYMDFMKQVALKTQNMSITYNDKRNVNMFYIINNYTEAKNFEDYMTPELTVHETRYIKGSSPGVGGLRLLTDRCITNVDVPNRPFHCVDGSRNKYLLRTNNDWMVDRNASRIIDTTIEKIKSVYDVDIKRSDKAKVRDKKLARLCELIDFEKTGKKKILKRLNKDTLLKNALNQEN